MTDIPSRNPKSGNPGLHQQIRRQRIQALQQDELHGNVGVSRGFTCSDKLSTCGFAFKACMVRVMKQSSKRIKMLLVSLPDRTHTRRCHV